MQNCTDCLPNRRAACFNESGCDRLVADGRCRAWRFRRGPYNPISSRPPSARNGRIGPPCHSARGRIGIEGQEPQMLIMYRGYQLVPVRSNESWQVKLFSGGKLIATTMVFATED